MKICYEDGLERCKLFRYSQVNIRKENTVFTARLFDYKN